MGSRDLDLIIRILKSRESDANLKKIKADINKIQKQLSIKIDYGKQIAKGMTQAATATEKLRKSVDALSKSFKALGREAGKEIKKISLQKTTNEVSKLVANVRRTNKEVGGFARSSISSFRKVTDSVGPATNAMSDMANMQSNIEKHTTTLDGLTSNLRTKYHALIPSLGQVANLFGSVSSNMSLTAVQTAKTFEALDLLSKKIREIQIVGRLRGILNLNQDIKSLKLFRNEIEKLRLDLASIRGERVAGREFGVTAGMVEDLRKARAEVDLLRERYVKLGQNVKELEKLNFKFKEQTGLINKTTRELGSYIRNSDKIKELPGKIQSTVTAYAKVRDEIIKVLKAMGKLNTVQGQTRAVYPEHFRKSWNILRKEFKEGSSEIEVLLKRIEGLHKQATQQIVKNNLQIAKSSRASIDAQRDDFVDLETLTSKQRASIEKLVQKYRELKVGLEYLGSGFRASAEAQKLSTEVLKESNALLSTLAPKYRRLAQDINAWTQANYKNISSGQAVSAILRQLSGDAKRLATKEKVLIETSKVLGNEQNLLEKRLRVARDQAKLYSDAIIRLTESLLKLNPAVAKDAIQIEKINAALTKLVGRSEAATKSVHSLSSSLTRVSLRGGDAVRAMHRVSAEGFGSMIISQAAWMAGFQFVFGTLDKFKSALMSVVELQEAVVRAMRTARSETMSAAEVYQAYTSAIVEARMRTGAAIADLGEIMYQLGSAGLSAEESIAALDSTLANIIGTEAEVRDITKLIAGLYNNFADSIVKVDGSMASLSATSREWTDSLIQSATLTEKFTYINDLLVAAFRDNQVEMMEMRDGLKFMIQSGKAANLALDEMVGILSFLNNHMIKSGQAGRAMRVILSKLTKDAAGFAEAFKIDIDLQKPLDFLEIMRKLNARYGGQTASVEELGKVFKKLGLRGAEAFNLIMRNVDTLEATIGNLQGTLDGAANEMERIRLSDLASQANIAVANIEALLRNGMIPLAEVLGILVGSLNAVSQGMRKMDSASGGIISSLVKIAGALGTVAASGLLIRNLTGIFSWFGTVLLTITNHVLGFGGAQKVAAGTTKNLTKSLFSLSSVFKGLSVLLVVEGLIWLTDYLATAAKRAREASEKHKKLSESYTALANKAGVLIPMLLKESEISKKNEGNLRKLSIQVGYIIDKNKSHIETLEELANATDAYMNKMKVLSLIQKGLAFDDELRAINSELQDLEKFGKIGIGVFEKLFIHTAKLFTQAGFGSGRPYVLKLFDQIILGKSGITRVSETIDELTKRIIFLESQKEVLPFRSKEIDKQIKNLEEVKAELVEIQDGLMKTALSGKVFSESFEDIGDQAKTLDAVSNSLIKGQSSSEDMAKILERLADHSKKFSSELNSLRKAIGSLEIMSAIFEELGTSGTVAIGGILEKLKEMEREKSIRNFSEEVEILSERIKAMPGEDNEIKRLIKDAARLGIDSSKMVRQFCKEIDVLKSKQLELAKSSSQLEMNNLAIEISGLGISTNETKNAISGLISATGKLQDKVDASRESVAQAGFESNRLRLIYRTAASGTDEYKKAQEGIMVQRKILSVLTERLTRHEMKYLNEVGTGIRTFKEMQDRTEKFIVTEENARIELIKMKGALELVKYGSEGYQQALNNVTDAQRKLTSASENRIRTEYEEIVNTINLQNAYSGIESSMKEQISLLGDWQRKYKEQQEMYENEIYQLGDSVDALNDKAKLYKDVEKSITDQIRKLDEQYTKEEELIKIAEKTGRLTASQAMVERLSKMSQHEADRLRLQKDLKVASEEHQAILATLDRDYDNAISTLEEGVKRVENVFERLQPLLAQIAQEIGDKIIGDKELALKIDRTELDEVIKDIQKLTGTYTLAVKVKYTEGKPIKEYYGGVVRAAGGLIPARVTNGEGYIPPSTAMGHLNALNTLNGGRATSSIPSNISKFHGPGGIDNIPALLPSGSYVLSTKGMAAYERSVSQGATGFQEGGEVNEEIMAPEGETKSEIGRFTIVVQKEGIAKEYPIYGRSSVLRELQEELETERLTKLH